MLIFWYRLKYFLQTILAFALALFVIGALCTARISRFSNIEGERVFYLQSASSQGLRKENLSFVDFPNIRGESVRFMLSERVSKEEFVESFAQEYGAEILFTETLADVTSYYGYTTKWTDGIMINGRKINLHIALSMEDDEGGTLCVIGSPIIFDGY